MMAIRHLKLRINRFSSGQTMAEYALILATVLVVCIAGYQVMGTTITQLIAQVDPLL
jgi:Flp pilus assembly pilin Flp